MSTHRGTNSDRAAAAKLTRRYPRGNCFHKTVLGLSELSPEECEAACDALTLWALHALTMNPRVALPYLYAALLDVWRNNRENLYGEADPRDRETVDYHAQLLATVGERWPDDEQERRERERFEAHAAPLWERFAARVAAQLMEWPAVICCGGESDDDSEEV